MKCGYVTLYIYYLTSNNIISLAAQDDTRIKPSILNVDINNLAALECFSSAKTKWFANSVTSEPISNQNTLEILSVSLKNTGRYYCYGSYDVVGKKNFLAAASIKVYGELFIPTDWHIIHKNTVQIL